MWFRMPNNQRKYSIFDESDKILTSKANAKNTARIFIGLAQEPEIQADTKKIEKIKKNLTHPNLAEYSAQFGIASFKNHDKLGHGLIVEILKHPNVIKHTVNFGSFALKNSTWGRAVFNFLKDDIFKNHFSSHLSNVQTDPQSIKLAKKLAKHHDLLNPFEGKRGPGVKKPKRYMH